MARRTSVVVVETWEGLIAELYRDCWDASIGRFRSPLVFRGVPDAQHDLSTSLVRLGTGETELTRIEGHLLRNFRKYAHRESSMDSLWNWLALAQHHGLPTRMLDWTYSPFVAMHFMTENGACFGQDGAIWCVNHCETNKRLPRSLRGVLEREGSNVFTAEMLDRIATTLERFDRLSARPFVVFQEPPSLDARIVHQFALFSLMSSPSALLHEWLAAFPELCRKVVVPASLKQEVRDKLDQANITERTLYPGLDGLARWLSRYYRPAEREVRGARSGVRGAETRQQGGDGKPGARQKGKRGLD